MSKIKIGDCFYPNSNSQDVMVLTHIDPIGYACLSKNGGMANQFYISKVVPIPTLHLPIGNSPKYGGAWFDMILGGVKKEEYREIAGVNKTYKNVGLLTDCRASLAQYESENFGEVYFEKLLKSGQFNFRPWKVLHLTNGYGPKNQQLWAHIDGITIGRGNPEWGAPKDRDVFIIRLGAVFHTKNLKP